MKWKDLKIAKKLFIGFGTVLILTVFVGLSGYWGFITPGSGSKTQCGWQPAFRPCDIAIKHSGVC